MVVNKTNIFSFMKSVCRNKWILLVIFIFFAAFSFAQDLNKKISLNEKDKPLGQVLNDISNLGQINFSYSPQEIPVDKKVSIKAKNKTIKEILDNMFKKSGITYTIVEKQIILKAKKTEVVQEPKEKPKYTISGYLKDKRNSETLLGATVYAKGTSMGTATNSYGFYSLTLPEGSYEIIFSFIGFEKTSQTIDLKENKNISVEMDVSKQDIKAVEIVSSTEESEIKSNQLSQIKFSPKIMSQLPGFVGDVDVIKSLQAIPGIKSYGDGSTMFYVRGGNSDQNLILIDEAPIYNPSHLFGFFTAIAPDAIKDVEAYKGDFPANYGGRLSSVIDIKMKDGNMKKFGCSGSLGPFTSSLSLEGPFKKEKASFYVSLRKSNLGWIKLPNYSAKTFEMKFSDFNVKLNYKINFNNHLFLTLYGGNDEYSRLFVTSHTFGINWKNNLGTLRWNHIFNDKLFSNTTVYYSRYNYFLNIWKENNDYWNSSIYNATVKTDFTFFLNPKNTFKGGIELSSHLTNPGNVHFAENDIQIHLPEIPQYTSRDFVFYISNEQSLNKKFSLRYGVRLPVWENIGPTTIYYFDENYHVMDTVKIGDKSAYSTFVSPEPRINITYSINEKSSFKISYCRATQFIQVLSNSTSPFTSLEVWVPSGPNIKPQTSDQFALGYFRTLAKSKLNFSAETFYKLLHHQIDYEDHANMLFNPLIEGELRFGEARAYGLELMLRKTEGKLNGWLGYTYSRALKQINGINNNQEFPANYDRPHNIVFNLSYNDTKHWVISANWIYLTGGAISTPTGFFYYNGYSVPIYGEKNNDRLPDYHRLDISVTYKFNKPERRYQHSLILTLYNAYGRKNPISVNFNKMMDDKGNFVVPANMDVIYELVPSTISVAGIIPSLTYNFKF